MPRLYVRSLKSVGAVTAGDNPEAHIMFWKTRNDTDPPTNVHDDDVTAGSGRPTGRDVMDLSKVTDDDLRKQLEEAFAKHEAAVAELEAKIAELEDEPEEDPVAKADPEVQRILKAQADEIAELRKSHESAVAKAREQDFTKRATDLRMALDGTVADNAAMLNTLEAAAPDAYAELEKKLVALAKLAEASNVFKEIGRGGDDDAAPDQDEWVQKNRKDGESVADARARYWTEHPDAAEDARSEAYNENLQTITATAGATFSTSDLYKFVVLNASGHVVLPNTTGNVLPLGTLHSVTNTTSGAGSEALTIGVAGVSKVRMAASTLAAGDFVASSTAGLGIAPTTDAYTAGRIVSGSSGAVNRVVSVALQIAGPLSTP